MRESIEGWMHPLCEPLEQRMLLAGDPVVDPMVEAARALEPVQLDAIAMLGDDRELEDERGPSGDVGPLVGGGSVVITPGTYITITTRSLSVDAAADPSTSDDGTRARPSTSDSFGAPAGRLGAADSMSERSVIPSLPTAVPPAGPIEAPLRVSGPDLAVTDLELEGVYEGRRALVRWEVTNVGDQAASVRGWTDQLVLSESSEVAPERSLHLGSWWTGPYAPLEPGESYTFERFVTVPEDAPDGAYLAVLSDRYDHQPEIAQRNNTGALEVTSWAVTEQIPSSQSSAPVGEILLDDVRNVVEAGLERLVRWATDTSAFDALGKPLESLGISVADALGGASDENAGLGSILADKALDAASEYFDELDAETDGDQLLAGTFEELGSLLGASTSLLTNAFGTVGVEYTFDPFVASRSDSVQLDFSESDASFDLELDAAIKYTGAAEFPRFTFGVDLTAVDFKEWETRPSEDAQGQLSLSARQELNLQDAFFIRLGDAGPMPAPITASLLLDDASVQTTGRIGFLGFDATLDPPSLGDPQDGVVLQIALDNPDGDAEGRLRLGELLSSRLPAFDLAVPFDATFTVNATVGGFAVVENGTISVSDLDALDGTLVPTFVTSDLDAGLDFGSLSSGDWTTLFGQLASVLTDLSSSGSFDLELPFASSIAGSSLDFGAAISSLLGSLTEDPGESGEPAEQGADGAPLFDTVQELVAKAAEVLGLDVGSIVPVYEPADLDLSLPAELALELQISEDVSADLLPLDLDFAIGPVDGVIHQVVRLSGDWSGGGTFTLLYDGVETDPIDVSADGMAFQTAWGGLAQDTDGDQVTDVPAPVVRVERLEPAETGGDVSWVVRFDDAPEVTPSRIVIGAVTPTAGGVTPAPRVVVEPVVQSAGQVTVVATVGVLLETPGDGFTVTPSTTLASLYNGDGVLGLSESAPFFAVQDADGELLPLDQDGSENGRRVTTAVFRARTAGGQVFDFTIENALTIGDVIAQIEQQTNFNVTARVTPGADSTTIEFLDSTAGPEVFSIEQLPDPSNRLSLAGFELGLIGVDNDLDGIIRSQPLHGEGWADRFFVEGVALSAGFSLVASNLAASTRYRAVTLEVDDLDLAINGSIGASLRAVDGSGTRLTLEQIFDAISEDPDPVNGVDDVTLDDILVGPTVSGSAELALRGIGSTLFSLPLPVEAEIGIEIPDLTEPTEVTITHDAAADTAALDVLTEEAFDYAKQYIGEIVGWIRDDVLSSSVFDQKLPIVNKSIRELVKLEEKLGELEEKLEDLGEKNLNKFADTVESFLTTNLRNPPRNEFKFDLQSRRLEFDIEEYRFDIPADTRLPVDLDLVSLLQGVGDLGGLEGIDSLLSYEAGGLVQITGGVAIRDLKGSLDLSDLFAPTFSIDDAFIIHDGRLNAEMERAPTQLEFQLGVNVENASFNASIGPFGGFVNDGVLRIGRQVLGPAPMTPAAAPATFVVTLNPADDGEYTISELFDQTRYTGAFDGEALVNLPIAFPTAADVLMPALRIETADLSDLFATTSIVSTPNFPDLMPNLELSFDSLRFDSVRGLAESLSRVIEQIDGILETGLLDRPLPIVGDALVESGDVLREVRDTLQEFRNRLNDPARASASLESELGALLADLGVLREGESLGVTATDSPDDNDTLIDEILFDLPLGYSATESLDVGFDLGLPAIGLTADGMVDLSIDVAFDLKFGVNTTDGFFLDTSGFEEFRVQILATIPQSFNVVGSLGFLQARVTQTPYDENNEQEVAEKASFFVGGFSLDLPQVTDTGRVVTAMDFESLYDSIEATDFANAFAGYAQVRLDIETGFDGRNDLPRILTGLTLDWDLGRGDPEFTFKEAQLDVGSFVRDIIDPVVGRVARTLEPIRPIIEVLTEPLPVLSQLGGGRVTLLDLARRYGNLGAGTIDFIEAARDILELNDSLGQVADGALINLGSLTLGGTGRAGDDLDSPARLNLDDLITENLLPTSEVDANGNGIADTLEEYADPGGGDPFTQYSRITGGGFAFPLIESPAEAFKMLLGQNATVFTYTTPKFEAGFTYSRFYPIIGPLGARITGSVGLEAQLSFGYDTFGLQQYAATDYQDVTKLAQGFFLQDRDANGREIKEFVLRGSLRAAAELNLYREFGGGVGGFGVSASGGLRAGVEGGLFATISADFRNDIQDGDGDNSRVRLGVLLDAGFDAFDLSGRLEGRLTAYAYAEACITIDYFFGSYSRCWTLFSYTRTFASVTLLDFSTAREPVSPPVLATEVDSTLTLNMTDGDDSFFVIQRMNDQGQSETVVRALGIESDPFIGVTNVVANGGAGNDTISIIEGFGGTLNAEIDGGAGNDEISYVGTSNVILRGGSGNDSISSGDGDDHLEGNGGNDVLEGGAGLDTLLGQDGADVLRGGRGNDDLDGGDGGDRLFGESGVDVLRGGLGDDQIEGGRGGDTIFGDAGDDQLFAGRSSDPLVDEGDVIHGGAGDDFIQLSDGGTAAMPQVAFGDAGSDQIIGGSGVDHISGGDDRDLLFGEGGDDLLYGADADPMNDDGTDGDSLSGGDGADTLVGTIGADIVDGGAGDDTIDGLAGNDRIDGGDGDDSIDAGVGNDRVNGGAGDDFIDAGAGADTVSGDADDDYIIGGSDSDWLVGGFGSDVIWGDEVPTVPAALPADRAAFDLALVTVDADGNAFDVPAFAEPGESVPGVVEQSADEIFGGAGNDFLFGLGGNDQIEGGAGNDLIDGGLGVDLLVGAGGLNIINAGDGSDSVYAAFVEPGRGSAVDRAVVYAGSSEEPDVLVGGPGADVLYGGPGDDTITGREGADRIFGEEGDDLLLAVTASGGDALGGDALGGDVVDGGAGADTITGSDGPDTLRGRAGDDVIRGFAGDDVLIGDAGNDTLTGDAGDDALYGGDGPDFLVGDTPGVPSVGADRLFGGAGPDKLTVDLVPGSGVATVPDQVDGHGPDEPGGAVSPDDSATDVLAVEATDADETILLGADPSESRNLQIVYTQFAPDGTVLADRTMLVQWRDDAGAARVEQFEIDAGNGENIVEFLSGPLALDVGDLLERSLPGVDGVGTNSFITVLRGGDDKDLLIGSAGRDLVIGGGGDDILLGNAANDRLWGDDPDDPMRRIVIDGNDLLFTGLGDDDAIGDDGDNGDLTGEEPDRVGTDPGGNDYLFAGLRDTEATIIGLSDSDRRAQYFDLAGGFEMNALVGRNVGLDGENVPSGEEFNRLDGESGSDRLFAGLGIDFLYGGESLAGDVDQIYDRSATATSDDIVSETQGDIVDDETSQTELLAQSWVDRARELSRVWYVPGSMDDDRILISYSDAGAVEDAHFAVIERPDETEVSVYLRRDASRDVRGLDQIWPDPEPTVGTQSIVTEVSAGAFNSLGLIEEDAFNLILVDGRDGNDTIEVRNNVRKQVWSIGGEGDDTILHQQEGVEPDDTYATGRFDILFGGPGDDRLLGGVGEDWIFGEAGNDVLSGGLEGEQARYDRILGGAGDDTFQLLPDLGAADTANNIDVFAGGSGTDIVLYAGRYLDRPFNIDRDHVSLSYRTLGDTDRYYQLDSLVWTGSGFRVDPDDGARFELASAAFEPGIDVEEFVFDGLFGDDQFRADSGYRFPLIDGTIPDDGDAFGIAINDLRSGARLPLTLLGGSGDDVLFGGPTNDRIDDGLDVNFVGGGADYFVGGLGDDRIDGRAGGDYLVGDRVSDVPLMDFPAVPVVPTPPSSPSTSGRLFHELLRPTDGRLQVIRDEAKSQSTVLTSVPESGAGIEAYPGLIEGEDGSLPGVVIGGFDLDGDGFEDLVLSGEGVADSYVFLGPLEFNGTIPVDATPQIVIGADAGRLADTAGDLTGDGTDDLLLVKADGSGVKLRVIEGAVSSMLPGVVSNASFEPAGGGPAEIDQQVLALQDVTVDPGDLGSLLLEYDDDAIADIVLYSRTLTDVSRAALAVYARGPLEETFELETSYQYQNAGYATNLPIVHSVIAPGDVNGDGLADLVIRADDTVDFLSPAPISVAYGRDFWQIPTVIDLATQSDGLIETLSLSSDDSVIKPVGDYNNDGLADFAIIGDTGFQRGIGILTGQARGAPVMDQVFQLPDADDLALADLDSDGALDLVVATEEFTVENGFVRRVFVVNDVRERVEANPDLFNVLVIGIEEAADLMIEAGTAPVTIASVPQLDVNSDGVSDVLLTTGAATRVGVLYGGRVESGAPDQFRRVLNDAARLSNLPDGTLAFDPAVDGSDVARFSEVLAVDPLDPSGAEALYRFTLSGDGGLDGARNVIRLTTDDGTGAIFDGYERDLIAGSAGGSLVRDPQSGLFEAPFGEQTLSVKGIALPDTTVSILEFDLSGLLGNDGKIMNATLDLTVESSSDVGGTFDVRLLEVPVNSEPGQPGIPIEADMRVTPQDAVVGGTTIASLTATVQTHSLDLRQEIQRVLDAGLTRMSLRIESVTPDLTMTIASPDQRGAFGTSLQISTQRVGLKADLFDSTGELLAGDSAVIDLSPLDAGTYLLRVRQDVPSLLTPATAPIGFGIEVTPPRRADGVLGFRPLSQRDSIDGGTGVDVVVGGPHLDVLRGGSGEDRIVGEKVEVRDAMDDGLGPVDPDETRLSNLEPGPLDPTVTFDDSGLADAVADELGISFARGLERPIRASELIGLTRLDASDREIRSLVGLEAASAIRQLTLASNQLRDDSMPILAGLAIDHLSLANNYIGDPAFGTTEVTTSLDLDLQQSPSGVVWVDRSTGPSVSADARLVAYLTPIEGESQFGEGTPTVVDRQSGRVLSLPDVATEVDISPDGTHVALINDADELWLVELSTGDRMLVSVPPGAGEFESIRGVSVSGFSSGRRVVAFTAEYGDPSRKLVTRDVTNAVTDIRGVGEQTRFAKHPVVSEDGNFVSFTLGPGGYNDHIEDQAFLRDTLAGTDLRISGGAGLGIPSNQTEWNGPTAISSDGRFTVFISGNDAIDPGDDNGFLDLYLFDLDSRTLERLTLDDELAAASFTGDVAISDDGRFVAYESVESDPSVGLYRIRLLDRQTGVTEQIQTEAFFPEIAGDAGSLVFLAITDDAAFGDRNAVQDVYAYDLASSRVEAVSNDVGFAAAGLVTTIKAITPGSAIRGTQISEDGRHVVYTTRAGNLVPGDSNGNQFSFFDAEPDVFVRDLVTGVTTRVNVSNSGAQSINGDSDPKVNLSATGRFVVFTSSATDLVEIPGDTTDVVKIFVRDRDVDSDGVFDEDGSSVLSFIDVDPDGLFGVISPTQTHVSDSGRYVVFASGSGGVFLHDRDLDENGVYDEPGGIMTRRANADALGMEIPCDADCLIDFANAGGAPMVAFVANGAAYTYTLASGAADEVMLPAGDQAVNIGLSDDGRFLAVERVDEDIALIELASGVVTDVPGRAQQELHRLPALSTDGRWLVYEESVSGDLLGLRQYDRMTGETRVVIDAMGRDDPDEEFGEVFYPFGPATVWYQHSVAGDGTVAFRSGLPELTADDVDGESTYDVFIERFGEFELASKGESRLQESLVFLSLRGADLSSSIVEVDGLRSLDVTDGTLRRTPRLGTEPLDSIHVGGNTIASLDGIVSQAPKVLVALDTPLGEASYQSELPQLESSGRIAYDANDAPVISTEFVVIPAQPGSGVVTVPVVFEITDETVLDPGLQIRVEALAGPEVILGSTVTALGGDQYSVDLTLSRTTLSTTLQAVITVSDIGSVDDGFGRQAQKVITIGHRTREISGFVLNDSDVIPGPSAGDVPLLGRRVFIDYNNDGVPGIVDGVPEPIAVTDNTGAYRFPVVRDARGTSGQIVVRQIVPSSWAAGPGGDAVSVPTPVGNYNPVVSVNFASAGNPAFTEITLVDDTGLSTEDLLTADRVPQIVLEFTEPVQVFGDGPRLQDDAMPGVFLPVDISGDGTDTLILTPNAPLADGDYRIVFDGFSIGDLTGNPLDMTSLPSPTFRIDGTGFLPEILLPGDGATNTDVGYIDVRFPVGTTFGAGDPADPANLSIDGLTVDRVEALGDGVTFRYWYSDDGDSLTQGVFDVSLVGGIGEDAAGNVSEATVGSFVYDTAPGIGSLILTGLVGPNNSVTVDPGYIDVQWTDGLAGIDVTSYGTNDIWIYSFDDYGSTSATVTSVEDRGGGVARYFHTGLPGRSVTIETDFEPSVRDLAGNAVPEFALVGFVSYDPTSPTGSLVTPSLLDSDPGYVDVGWRDGEFFNPYFLTVDQSSFGLDDVTITAGGEDVSIERFEYLGVGSGMFGVAIEVVRYYYGFGETLTGPVVVSAAAGGVTDFAGNGTAATLIGEFVIDRTRPVAQLRDPSGADLSAGVPFVSADPGFVDVDWTDAVGAINPSTRDASNIEIAGVTVTSAVVQPDGATRYSYDGELPSGRVSVRSTGTLVDMAGNSSLAVEIGSFFVDRTGPQVVVLSPMAGDLRSGSLTTVELLISDGGIGLDPASVDPSDLEISGVGADSVMSSGPDRFAFTFGGVLPEGINTIRLVGSVTDLLGNAVALAPDPDGGAPATELGFFIVDTTPAAVLTGPVGPVEINTGAGGSQRSNILDLSVTISDETSLNELFQALVNGDGTAPTLLDAVSVVNTTAGDSIALNASDVQWSSEARRLTLRVSDGPTTRLTDGRYAIRIDTSLVRDALDRPLDDDDGVVDGMLDVTAPSLFRLAGDLTGDAVVDETDATAVLDALSEGLAADLNGDGVTNTLDYLYVVRHLGNTL